MILTKNICIDRLIANILLQSFSNSYNHSAFTIHRTLIIATLALTVMVSATLLYIAETSKAVDPYKTAATVIEPTSSKATVKPLSPRRVVAGMLLPICAIDH